MIADSLRNHQSMIRNLECALVLKEELTMSEHGVTWIVQKSQAAVSCHPEPKAKDLATE